MAPSVDTHGRVIAHLPSGPVVATLSRIRPVRANAKRKSPRADVYVCGALVLNVAWGFYSAQSGALLCEGPHA